MAFLQNKFRDLCSWLTRTVCFDTMSVTVPIKDLDAMLRKALLNIGFSAEDSETMTKVMMHAEICGNNQGISKMYRPQDMGFNKEAGPLIFENESPQAVVEAGPLIFENESPQAVVVNGNRRSGMVALSKAIDKVVEKASATGFAIAGTHNTCTSTGMLAYYANRIAEAGFIALVFAGSPEMAGFVALVFAGSPEMVAPVGGKSAIFGTNPICIAIPGAEGGPIVLDMATAATTLFGTISVKV
ncbi:Malate/L-lactate dehydrogenase [Baffinella frigidus]|nr:Malate/L-lactate dehydrogenase [Cryptophyta sp. CCMP2293]